MLDRRAVLLTGAATAALAATGNAFAEAAPKAANSEAAKMSAMFDAFMDEVLRLSVGPYFH